MIKNETQLTKTRTDLNKLKNIRRRTAQLVAAHFGTQEFADAGFVSKKIEELESDIDRFRQVYPRALEIHFGELRNLGEKLVIARIAVGYSQRDLAKQCNITQQQISNHEGDLYKTATLERLTVVANVLERELCKLKAEQASDSASAT